MLEKEAEPFEPDSEFILRLPPAPAASLREAMRTESKHLKSRFKIEIQEDMRHATVKFDNWKLRAKVYDLPSLMESHKTLDRKVFYKVADISQMLVCKEEADESSEEESPKQKLDRDGRDKRYLYPHGITPCLKNVRKKRFRKTLRKRVESAPTVEKEVKMLLKTDAEAISTWYELLSVEDDKQERPESKAEEEVPKIELGEYELFGGEVSSSSEESEAENHDPIDCNGILDHIKEEPSEPEQSAGDSTLISQQESEMAERNLGQILEEQNGGLVDLFQLYGSGSPTS